MRNMLAFVAAAALTVVGVGWYLGWYGVSSTPTQEGKCSINIELNTTKIDADLRKGEDKIHQALEKRHSGNDTTPAGGQESSEKTTVSMPPDGGQPLSGTNTSRSGRRGFLSRPAPLLLLSGNEDWPWQGRQGSGRPTSGGRHDHSTCRAATSRRRLDAATSSVWRS